MIGFYGKNMLIFISSVTIIINKVSCLVPVPDRNMFKFCN